MFWKTFVMDITIGTKLLFFLNCKSILTQMTWGNRNTDELKSINCKLNLTQLTAAWLTFFYKLNDDWTIQKKKLKKIPLEQSKANNNRVRLFATSSLDWCYCLIYSQRSTFYSLIIFYSFLYCNKVNSMFVTKSVHCQNLNSPSNYSFAY